MTLRDRFGGCNEPGCPNAARGKHGQCDWHRYGLTRVFNQKRNKAVDNGTPFDLTMDWFQNAAANCNGTCPCCGGVMEFRSEDMQKRISFDRIDSAGGYTEDNVQLICFRCNTLKSAGDLQDRLNLVKNDVLTSYDASKVFVVMDFANNLVKEFFLRKEYDELIDEERAAA